MTLYNTLYNNIAYYKVCGDLDEIAGGLVDALVDLQIPSEHGQEHLVGVLRRPHRGAWKSC